MKNHYQKLISIICLLTLFTFLNGYVVLAEDDPDISQEPPSISIGTDQYMPVLQAGTAAELNIPLKNRNDSPVSNVKVTLDIGDIKSAPFTIDNMQLTKHLPGVGKNSLVTYKLRVLSSAKSQLYPVTVTASWSSSMFGSGSDSATIYVKIENNLKQPSVKLQQVKFEGNRIPAGKTSLVSLIMYNDSSLDIKNMEIKLSGFAPNTINVDNCPDTLEIKSMKAGEIKPADFRLYFDPALESGTYTLDLAMKYTDLQDTEYTKEMKIYLPVSGKGSNDDLTPRVIIDNYTFGGEYAQAGKTFPLTLSLLNTSKSKAIENLKVSLSSEGGVFSPAGGSNSFYVAELLPQGKLEKTLAFKPKTAAESGTHIITATLDYQDESGTKLSETEVISIPVAQQLQLTTSEVVIPDQVFAQSPTAITLDFYNTGRALIRNLMITTKGDFPIQNGDVYIGNLESGKNDYYDVTVLPGEKGNFKGMIILEYDDETGQHFKLEKPFTLNVEAAQEIPVDPGMEQPQPEQSKIPKWAYAVGAGVLALLAIWFIVRRIRKKKQEVELDE